MRPIPVSADENKLLELKEKAINYLKSVDRKISVMKIGLNLEGIDVYSIFLVDNNGDAKELYKSPDGVLSSVMLWDNEEDANTYAENHVLPGIGLSCTLKEHYDKIRQFQRFLADD